MSFWKSSLAAVTLFTIASAAFAADPPKVKIAQGALIGAEDNGVSAFRGIPYAAPPVGARRWTPPAAPASWGDTPRDASRFGASCPQEILPGGRAPWTPEYMSPQQVGTSEDCLFVNVWTASPRPDAKLPVLVFIHGGGNTEGAGSVPIYNGANLAKKGIVVVNLNYRLAALGFMAHPALTAEQGRSGNYATQDQIAALRWVQTNISAFGGDPAKVTIAGQSAGAGAVVSLLYSPAAKGLFRGAVVQSGGLANSGRYGSLADAEKNGAQAMEKLGATSLAQARALTADQLVAARLRGGPVADGVIIPTTSPLPMASDVPIMVGFTANDSAAAKRTVTAAAWKADVERRYGAHAAEMLKLFPGKTDAEATASANREAAERFLLAPLGPWVAKRTTTQPVYAYLFTHPEPGPESDKWGAFHSAELPYVFNTLHLSPNRTFTAVDRQVAEQTSAYWANFTKTGDPNGGGLPKWQAMTPANHAIMDIGAASKPSRLASAEAEALYATSEAPKTAAELGLGPPPPPPPR